MTEQLGKDSRIKAIDRFRGIAVFCMIFFQFIKNFDVFGIFTKIAEHNVATGIPIFFNTTIADLIAPMFMFALALTYKISYDRRVQKYGEKSTNLHFLIRNTALIGFGSFLTSINKFIDLLGGHTLIATDYIYLSLSGLLLVSIIALLITMRLKNVKKYVNMVFWGTIVTIGLMTLVLAGIDFFAIIFDVASYTRMGYWLVLQSLGFAGLVALPFMKLKLKLKYRSILTFALLAVYTLYYNLGGQPVVNAVTQGGFIGGFGWGILILFGTIFSELYLNNKKYAYFIVLGMIALSVGLYFALPILKSGVRPDPTYLVVTMTISSMVFLIVDLFNFYKFAFDPLAWWGRYPFLLYLLEFGAIGLYVMVAPENLVNSASLPVALITTAVVVVGLTTLVYFLNKKNKKISL